jgi:broad specificity phosphatase PhoE
MEQIKQTTKIQDIEFLNDGSQVLLLRHANSQFNYEYDQMQINKTERYEEYYQNLRIKKDLRDAPLSLVGIQQCMKAQAMANKIKAEYIVVSPLRRALETAYYTFKSHPNFDNIKFVLLPVLKEGLDTACDIPVNIFDTIEEFKQKFTNFDTSEIYNYRDAEHYFFTDIDQDFSKNIMSAKVHDANDPLESNAFELTLETIDKNFPNRLESTKNILSRVEKAKKFVGEFLQRKSFEDDSKVVVVGHSCYFKYWTGKWEKEISTYNDDIPSPKHSVWLQN